MSRFNVTEKTPFSLEMDDRTEEEKSQAESAKNDRLASALGMGGSEKAPAPMDSNYQEDLEGTMKKIRFNSNFGTDLTEAAGNKDQRDETKKFSNKQVFEAASSGDVAQLQGLHLYLQQSKKQLTNSEYQDKNGKNVLLKALLNLKNGRNDAVEYLLNIAEKMGDLDKFVNAAYTDSFYKGQSALHIAIERRSTYFVQLLVQKGADVHAKACGKFFQEKKGACFYFGELPLSLAACTNQLDIVEFLMDNPHQRVCVTETDSQGNMVLHALVKISDNTPENTDFVTMMYDEILTRAATLHPKTKLEDIENHQGLTPIKLAAKTGKIGLFTHMMQREFQNTESKHLSRKFTEWVYGPVHCSLYDLDSIDSYENNSVLEIIVYGCGIPNRHAMLDVGPLSRLLNEKWNRFARWIFNFNFFVYLVYLSVFSLVAYNRQDTKTFTIEHSTFGYLLLSGQAITAVGALFFFIKGILDFNRKHPMMQSFMADGYSDCLFFLQAVLFFITAVLFFYGRKEYVSVLVVSLALSWLNLLYYFRGYRSLGIYSVMIQKMIFDEILRFLLVYMVFLFGFSAAVVTLLDEPSAPNVTTPKVTTPPVGKGRFSFAPIEHPVDGEKVTCEKPTFKSIHFALLQLFKFTIGMGDLEFTEKYQNKVVFYVLLISYILLTYILLLNMLIALMSKKVEDMTKESTSIWKLQRAITTLDVERTLPRCLKDRLRSGVQKQLGGTAGEEKRWCLRVEEVNWNKWNTDLGITNEDPGGCEFRKISHPDRESAWRRTLRPFNRRTPRHRTGHEMSTSVTQEGTTLYQCPPDG
ncbi:hypothetical protein SKAU_G00328230 [Synaphobranchus kaupii]|uniref:Ion transport domain-containing protein n=1 Tax=Synaphobranchus kaupii TaxID=118154 RepID=A0A9Q1EQ48_SYNKA|nr:hypothetical protein SKAU_G00328230 [Synaphobranchus kaupii]